MGQSIDNLVKSKSKFLSKEDCGEAGMDLTVFRFTEQDVGKDGETERKYVIEWRETDVKPMVLNKQNANRLKAIAKSDDIDRMIGLTVNVYNDPFVEFGGKTVGGLRIRPIAHARYQENRPQQARPQQAQRQPEYDGPETPPVEAYEEPSYTKDVPF